MKVDAAPVQSTVRVRGVVYDKTGGRSCGCLKVGTAAKLMLVHPVGSLFELCVSNIKATEDRAGGEKKGKLDLTFRIPERD